MWPEIKFQAKFRCILLKAIMMIMVKNMIADAGDGLSQAGKYAMHTFGYIIGSATDVAKNMLKLFF